MMNTIIIELGMLTNRIKALEARMDFYEKCSTESVTDTSWFSRFIKACNDYKAGKRRGKRLWAEEILEDSRLLDPSCLTKWDVERIKVITTMMEDDDPLGTTDISKDILNEIRTLNDKKK